MADPLKMIFPFNRMAFTWSAIKHLMVLVFIALWFSNFQGQGFCQEGVEKLGFTLPVPETEHHRNYLGLSDGDRFSLGQIKAKVVIIEIFSMYCPICQREAADVNDLFHLIQNKPDLKEKVKLIGIGAGNSAFEVNFFKEKYAIEFPLFSDSDFSIHKRLGEVRTPHFLGLELQGNGSFTLFYSQSGEISDPERFLQTLLEQKGVKKQP